MKIDSKLVEGWLDKKLPNSHPHFYLILNCKKLMMFKERSVHIQYCYRDANCATDWPEGVFNANKRVVISSPTL